MKAIPHQTLPLRGGFLKGGGAGRTDTTHSVISQGHFKLLCCLKQRLIQTPKLSWRDGKVTKVLVLQV